MAVGGLHVNGRTCTHVRLVTCSQARVTNHAHQITRTKSRAPSHTTRTSRSSSSSSSPMKLLVTTGATVTFKPLVRLAVLPLFLDLMARHGVNLLFVQYGNHIVDGVNCLTQFVNECIDWEKDIEGADGRAQYVYHGAQGDVAVELFPFSNKLCDYIAASDFVVSHGGTGTILDVLRGNRPLVVVYNEELMDNHQAEVSRELAAMGHCLIVGSLGLDVAVFTAVFERLVGGEVQLKRFGGGSSVVRDVLYGELARARA